MSSTIKFKIKAAALQAGLASPAYGEAAARTHSTVNNTQHCACSAGNQHTFDFSRKGVIRKMLKNKD